MIIIIFVCCIPRELHQDHWYITYNSCKMYITYIGCGKVRARKAYSFSLCVFKTMIGEGTAATKYIQLHQIADPSLNEEKVSN